MSNLAVKYRPTTFEDVCAQSNIIKVLEKQLSTNSIRNCYLFTGPSGCGKTTLARILANKINRGLGSPIEIDGASNNGVDNVRLIVDSSQERSLDSEYKIFIIDECHMITTQGWNAFLKCIEEPPVHTIFMFCTTDPQKVPITIVNRCQEFHLTRIPEDQIRTRLETICHEEGYMPGEGVDYIVKICQGSMRQAISYLDKCKDFSNQITLENAIECLGDYSYDIFFDLTNARIDGNKKRILEIIESLYQNGNDLKIFIDKYFDFILDISKYCLLNDISLTKIPESMKESLEYTVNIEDRQKFFNSYLDKILNIKQTIKGDSNAKTTIEVMLLA